MHTDDHQTQCLKTTPIYYFSLVKGRQDGSADLTRACSHPADSWQVTSGLAALGWPRDLSLFHRSLSSLGRTVQAGSQSSDRQKSKRKSRNTYVLVCACSKFVIVRLDTVKSRINEGEHYQRVWI